MFKKNVLLSLCLLFCLSFSSVSFADAAVIIAPHTPMVYNVDIPSGYTATGFAYGLARLAYLREQIHGKPVNIDNIVKIADKQYQVTCTSQDPFCNGTFIVDIFSGNENSLKEGYQLWFSIFDPNFNKSGTAQVKRKQ